VRTRRLTVQIAVACALLAVVSPTSAAAALDKDGAVTQAARLPAVRAQLSQSGGAQAVVERQNGNWVVTFAVHGRARAQVELDPLTGRVLHVFTGQRAEFPLARGPQSGVAQRKLNALWAWLPLTAIFVLAFFDWKRPFRLLHLDLLAVAALGVSFAFFMRGRLSASVPLVYPTLLYVVGRSLLAGFTRGRNRGPLSRLSVGPLVGITVALLVARAVLALADPFVLDVGYASAAGADRILHGLVLYTRGGTHFDTYGPLAYLTYVPFVALWPFDAAQQVPGAAQAAAIVFDLLTVAGLVALGRRLRPGTQLGWALAVAWVACPFTALALVTASNDALVAALLVWAFVGFSSGAVRGGLLGAAAAAKFSPALVLPLFMRGARWSVREAAVVPAAFGAIAALTLIPLLPPGGLSEFYDTTVGFQLHRFSPFSLWTLHPGLGWLQTLTKLAAIALALGVAVVPRGARTFGQTAGLATAVLVAEQIPLNHWFYLYVPWFVPLYCLAVFSEHDPAVAGGRPGASLRLPRRGGEPASYTARS
jgi:hypothetical protein